MSTRSDYTADEWEAIRRAPAEAVIAVEQASPSGYLGRRREHKAAEKEFGLAIVQYAGMGLVDAIVAAKDEEGRLVDALRAGGEPMVDTAVETAARARRAIHAKGTTEELEAYVNAIIATIEAVAMASGERGEADKVSTAESLLLRRLAGALGRPEYEPPKDDWTSLAPARRNQ